VKNLKFDNKVVFIMLCFLCSSSYVPPNDYCLDKRLFSQVLAADERNKHAYYSQRHQDEVCKYLSYHWTVDRDNTVQCF